jgi:glycosyltransferase involved in cell wall biosynthesis
MRLLPESDPPIDFSLILCTRNRAEALSRTFAACEGLRTAARWEMIVVDNGSTDATAALIAGQVRAGRLPLVLVQEPRPGLARARNAGLRHASGRIIGFTDDDCYPAADFVDAWLNVFATLPLDYAGGRVELFDPADAAVTIKTSLVPETYPPGRFVMSGFIHGANMAFRHETVAALGPFLEQFGAGAPLLSAEDFEYYLRAAIRGFRGGYRPEPVVWHHHGRKADAIPRLMQWYEISRGAVYAHLLLHHPGFLLREALAQYREQGSLLAYAKSVYWLQCRRSRRTTIALARGMAAYLLPPLRAAMLRRWR